MNLRFQIHQTPKAWERVRHNRARFYTSYEDRKYQETVWMECLAAGGRSLMFKECPVWVALDFFMAKPPNTKYRVYPAQKPDLDNLVKNVLDGLRPLWTDDALVVSLVARKAYSKIEFTEVRIDDEESLAR